MKKVRMLKGDWSKPKKAVVVDEVKVKHFHGEYEKVLQLLKFEKGTPDVKEFELRLCYYDGRKWGQFAPILPEDELLRLLKLAKEKGILSGKFKVE